MEKDERVGRTIGDVGCKVKVLVNSEYHDGTEYLLPFDWCVKDNPTKCAVFAGHGKIVVHKSQFPKIWGWDKKKMTWYQKT